MNPNDQYTQYTEAEATQAALEDGYIVVRIASRDGHDYPTPPETCDDRINFDIKNNRVVNAWKG